MATATTLAQAAGQAFDNLHIRWLSNSLKGALTTFCQTTLDTFPEAQPDFHPVSNWLVLISGFAVTLPTTNVPINQLTTAAQYVYRLCWMASFLQSSGQISTTQANFLLASYNVIIGFP